MRRAPVAILVAAFCLLGTGSLGHLHLRVHAAAEHTQADAIVAHTHDDEHDDGHGHGHGHNHEDGDDVLDAHLAVPAERHDHEHEHDEDDCGLCVQLHLAALPVAWVPHLICLGLLVAFLTLLAPRLHPQRVALRIACRGPPRG